MLTFRDGSHVSSGEPIGPWILHRSHDLWCLEEVRGEGRCQKDVGWGWGRERETGNMAGELQRSTLLTNREREESRGKERERMIILPYKD